MAEDIQRAVVCDDVGIEERGVNPTGFSGWEESAHSNLKRVLKTRVAVATSAANAQQTNAETLRPTAVRSRLERRLMQQLLVSVVEERKRISRDLHDDIGQELAALLLDVRSSLSSDQSRQEIRHQLEQGIRQVMEKVSALVRRLRPPFLDGHGLEEALQRHIGRLRTQTGLDIDYEFVCPDALKDRIAGEIDVALYRIAQESLHNVARHAEAAQVSVVLLASEDAITLVVEDDGNGFDLGQEWRKQGETSFGLLGIKERVSWLGGSLKIETGKRRGTTIKVTFSPWVAQDKPRPHLG